MSIYVFAVHGTQPSNEGKASPDSTSSVSLLDIPNPSLPEMLGHWEEGRCDAWSCGSHLVTMRSQVQE